jgi:SPP1 family predicted phage head-tail adaptor
MNSRRLNRLVTLQRRNAGQDALGQPLTTWADVASVWAHIRYLSGVETIKGGAETAATKASIRIRWRTDVTPAMRVSIGTTVFQINAVLPDEARRDHVDLACEVLL